VERLRDGDARVAPGREPRTIGGNQGK
jgi:hypothetical protein